jgi:hypothetical protein
LKLESAHRRRRAAHLIWGGLPIEEQSRSPTKYVTVELKGFCNQPGRAPLEILRIVCGLRRLGFQHTSSLGRSDAPSEGPVCRPPPRHVEDRAAPARPGLRLFPKNRCSSPAGSCSDR